MKTNSKKWLKRLGIFLGTLILIVVGYVVYVFSSYYRLEDKQKLTITGKSTEKAKTRKVPESEYLAEMKDPNNILEVENLHSYFFTDQGVVKAVNGVYFNIPLNSTVGVVGESGCGKSVTSMSIMRLLQGPTGQIVEGSIRFKAIDFKRDDRGNFMKRTKPETSLWSLCWIKRGM